MEWTGYIMAKDTIVAAVDDGWVSVCDQRIITIVLPA